MTLLRDRRSEFDEAGVRLFGLSRDTIYSQEAWRKVLDLNFPLLSDFNADALRALGVAAEWRRMADVPVRSAFLVDRDGIIRGAWRYGPSQVPDVDELLVAARSLS
jgi:glutaredoxin-dependent peroxiredoxin